MDANIDPLEGSSQGYGHELTVKSEMKEENIDEEEACNTMALLELATCIQTNDEPIEFNSTDAMVNPKTGLMVCLLCLEELAANLLSDHMVNAHSYRRVLFKCHICGSRFEERRLLNVHRKDCKPPVKKRRKTFAQNILCAVEGQIKDSNEFDNVSCPICLLEVPKCFIKDHLLCEHSAPEITLTCMQCGRVFKSKLTLREHIKLVHLAVENSEECDLCGQKFSSLKYLANHKRNVHPSGNKSHKCDICSKQFKSHLCLHQHMKYVHPPSSASVPCPHCPNKIYKSKISLQQHLRVSHGVYSDDKAKSRSAGVDSHHI